MSLAPLLPTQLGFHKSGVPIVNAELPNPSSCFIVPLSMGHSLNLMPCQLSTSKFNQRTQNSNKDERTMSKFQENSIIME